MSRSWKALLACVFVFSFLPIVTGAAPVQAVTTWDFRAESLYPGIVSDFSLQYSDKNGDGRLTMNSTINEFITGTFSGFWYYGIFHQYVPAHWVSVLVSVPGTAYVPLTDGSGGDAWAFLGDHGSYFMGATFWRYSETPVPIPSSVFLLGAGLIGLVVARRNKRLG
jgi:hypothetical protein